jgi:hypothetical protein
LQEEIEYDGDGYYPYDAAGASGDLADDLNDPSMQQQHTPLLELPAPCLQRLTALLPRHRSVVLRQGSKALQQQVDAARGVALVLEDSSSDAQHAAAMSVSAASLITLSTCSISATASLQQLLQAVQAAAGGLPKLRDLRCDIDHLELLNAVAAVSPQLSSITLFSKRDQAELLAVLDQPLHEERYVELLQDQLPGALCPSCTALTHAVVSVLLPLLRVQCYSNLAVQWCTHICQALGTSCCYNCSRQICVWLGRNGLEPQQADTCCVALVTHVCGQL